MDAKTVGVVLLVIYMLTSNDPIQRIIRIVDSMDPSLQNKYDENSWASGWRARLHQGVLNGAKITILAAVLKLTGLLPYPFTDQAWAIFAIVMTVLMTAINMYTNKAFYTDELLAPGDVSAGPYVFDIIAHFLRDLSDLLIVGLLIVSTVKQDMFKQWMPKAILIILLIGLTMGVIKDFFDPDFLRSAHTESGLHHTRIWDSVNGYACAEDDEYCQGRFWVFMQNALYGGFDYGSSSVLIAAEADGDPLVGTFLTSQFLRQLPLLFAVIALTGKSL